MCASAPQKRRYFHVGRETTAMLWNKSTFQLCTSAMELPATILKAADMRPLRQTRVAFTAGGALLFFSHTAEVAVLNHKFLLHRETYTDPSWNFCTKCACADIYVHCASCTLNPPKELASSSKCRSKVVASLGIAR